MRASLIFLSLIPAMAQFLADRSFATNIITAHPDRRRRFLFPSH
jgi:hypothetical protein